MYIYVNSRAGSAFNNFSLGTHKEIPADTGYISVEIYFRRVLYFPRYKAGVA